MSDPELRVEPLSSVHAREKFSCGVDSLDRYLHKQAGQDMRRKANAVFVLTEVPQPDRILGYFTLCATALVPGDIPEEVRRHLPRYPLVSATLIGRLAVDKDCQGRGLGGLLLANALRQAWESASTVGSCMVVVDVVDESAAAFYSAHGFLRLPDSMRLVLPMRTVARLLEPRG